MADVHDGEATPLGWQAAERALANRLLDRFGQRTWPTAGMSDVARGWLATSVIDAAVAAGGLDHIIDEYGEAAELVFAAAVSGYRMLGVDEMAALASEALEAVRWGTRERSTFEFHNFVTGVPTNGRPALLVTLDRRVVDTTAERAGFASDHHELLDDRV